MTTPKLKPCPFCGGKQVARKDETGQRYAIQNHTVKCPLWTGAHFIFDFAAWNRRYPVKGKGK